ncbi:DUF2971 domain-containing protein [Pectobacterium polonicum]|uniref:DUF2971 domain-containing protein n=2 Tax=Pectobacterium polonicum TaxID=2485124 RepID=UPI003754D0FA
MKIHHYTNLSSLALILKNKTIRFTRADLLDDIHESYLNSTWRSSMGYFISSWSIGVDESIPQWAMYGDSFKGVRLIIDDDDLFPMNKINVNLARKCENGEEYGIYINDLETPFNNADMFGEGYVLIPSLSSGFKNPVTYVDNVKCHVDSLITRTENGMQLNSASAAFIKSDSWKYQNEFRFSISAMDGPQLCFKESPDKYEDRLLSDIYERFSNENIGDLNKNNTPLVKYIDLRVSSTAFDSLHVQLGPLAPTSSRIIVESLCEKYAPNTVIKESNLSSQIREKM